MLLCAASALAQQPPLVHFHDLRFNSVDREAAIEFYTTRLHGVKRQFAGQDAVEAGL